MKKMALFGLAVAPLLLSAQMASALSLTLQNQTGKELHELYFAPAGEEDWGPDQLGDEVVENNGSFALTNIPKGKYDVLFVDEEGSKCGVRDVDFTGSETFAMTKSLMKGCQKGTDQAEGEEE